MPPDPTPPNPSNPPPQLEGYDEIVIDQLMVKIAEDDFRVRTIITEVTTSYLFTHQRVR